MYSRLAIQTSRARSSSNASDLSIVSPTSSSTNASTSSLLIPAGPSRSPSPIIDDTVRLGPEYVLAMHDYSPQQQSATCLSFRAGQVIHVLNRDKSGWWDGELDGRRGWFPSNYVNADMISPLIEEELPKRGHAYHQSTASATSWTTTTSAQSHSTQQFTSDDNDLDPYCPPLMVPLLHGLSLLQGAVRANRVPHFQPSTACIISCVRAILAATGTLQRDAPILQQFAILTDERRRILTILASLVSQAKKVSEGSLDPDVQDLEVESMLRLGGQVFSHVRTFLAIAVKCGIDVPDEADVPPTATPNTEAAQMYAGYGQEDSPTRTPTQYRGRPPDPRPAPRVAGPRARENSPKPLPQPRPVSNRHQPSQSISSISSSSSLSSQESIPQSPPPFPCGPSTAAQVMEALRFTHDHYLSTIAAFIGHAHSHSRTSHASSTGVLYDLVKEIVEMVCKLLTIVEAVLQHPDVPAHRVGNLRSAKEGLYTVTSSLAESVRLLTLSLPPTMTEEAEKQILLRSATSALKAGADCVAAVKVCLSRSIGDRPFIVKMPDVDNVMAQQPVAAGKFPLLKPRGPVKPLPSTSSSTPGEYHLHGMDDEDLTIQAQTPSPVLRGRDISSGSDNSSVSKSSWMHSDSTRATSPDDEDQAAVVAPVTVVVVEGDNDPASPTSVRTMGGEEDGATTWEGSVRSHHAERPPPSRGELPLPPVQASALHPPPAAPMPTPMLRSYTPSLSTEEDLQDPSSWMFGHDYLPEDVAYNGEGLLVGATMSVLVEKMTPHDSIVDPAFSAVFFMTFRLFSSPLELVETLIKRYNLQPPEMISDADRYLWQQRKGLAVRLRVSNFIKNWVEVHWRTGVDDVAIAPLVHFTADALKQYFPTPAGRILEMLAMRSSAAAAPLGSSSIDAGGSPKADRSRDPGMSINPPTALPPPTEIPRPTMTKTLLVALRRGDFGSISILDFDAVELARQLTIMECSLYGAIMPEEILNTGLEGVSPPVGVRAVSSLSTVVTGWVAESILSEMELKKRTVLVKFFVKVADRCSGLNNYSTSRSILAALDSSTISRLHQTWAGLPQKYKAQLEALRKLADHSRNYHEYRTRLRNTAPPAVPFLGLYLTDVTFCREGNPSFRTSPMNPDKRLINFNKYHKLARIVQDMQRFQVPYNLKAIPEVQQYLNVAFDNSKHHGDLEDLYRRSLLVEPKQTGDQPPTSDMRQLFSWATRSGSQPQTTS